MVDRAGTRVTGLKETVAKLQGLGADVDDLKDAFAGIARRGAALAVQYVRSRTGRLAGTVRGNRAKSKAVVTAGRASVRYAGVQNYGWPKRGITPQLFMQRADVQLRPFALQSLERDVQAKIRKRGLN